MKHILSLQDFLLKESLVLEYQTNTEILYHATNSTWNVPVMNGLGFHAGTLKAAKDRMKSFRMNINPHIKMFKFDLKNPLFINRDYRFHDSLTKVSNELYKDKIISKQERDNFLRIYDDNATFENLRKLLHEKYGYDGIIYKNNIEDRGSNSYIAFYPEQIEYIGIFESKINIFSEKILEYSNNLILNLKKKFLVENPTLTDDQMDYYINTFDKHKDRFDVKDRDINKYSFSKLEHFIDQKIPRSKSSNSTKDDNITPLYENDNVKIYLADTKMKSIILGKGTSWCISRRDSSNMYNTYRDLKNKTIYFVYTLTKKYVILVDESNKYYLADESNSGDFTGSESFTFQQILKFIPALEGCKRYFKHTEGGTTLSKKMNNIDFENLIYDDKDKYISYGHELTDAQYYILDNDLKSKYINLGHKLTDPSYVETIPRLQKRYLDIQISSDMVVRLSEIQLSDLVKHPASLVLYCRKLGSRLSMLRRNLTDYELNLIPFEYLKNYFESNYRYLNDTEKEFYKENTDRVRKEISEKTELSSEEYLSLDESEQLVYLLQCIDNNIEYGQGFFNILRPQLKVRFIKYKQNKQLELSYSEKHYYENNKRMFLDTV